MAGAIKTITPNYGLKIPNFDVPGWNKALEQNFNSLDSLLFFITGISNVSGTWENNKEYTAGDRVFDPVEALIWQALVDHTSSADVTFLAERTAHPTYWQLISTSFTNRGEWVTATAYNTNEFLYYSNKYGVANGAFTSSASFDTDVANGDINVLIDFTAFTPAGYASKTANQTISGLNTFTGANIHQGANTFEAAVEFNGAVDIGGALLSAGVTIKKLLDIQFLSNTTSTALSTTFGAKGIYPINDYVPKSATSKLLILYLPNFLRYNSTAGTHAAMVVLEIYRETGTGTFSTQLTGATISDTQVYPANANNKNRVVIAGQLDDTMYAADGKWTVQVFAQYVNLAGTIVNCSIEGSQTILVEYE